MKLYFLLINWTVFLCSTVTGFLASVSSLAILSLAEKAIFSGGSVPAQICCSVTDIQPSTLVGRKSWKPYRELWCHNIWRHKSHCRSMQRQIMVSKAYLANKRPNYSISLLTFIIFLLKHQKQQRWTPLSTLLYSREMLTLTFRKQHVEQAEPNDILKTWGTHHIEWSGSTAKQLLLSAYKYW